ncbi:cation acetate symporter [Streptomyces sp. NPDC057271]|uniref:sodium/solute symporter n=1 Tax=unclassified Streptomyces TaxID=2593676 RepID=UPI0036410D7F
MNQTYGVVAVTSVFVLSGLIGALGLRISRTTSDFYVASRSVPPRLNAAAVSGEYLSAASFLGVAGLVLAQGFDMLWVPVGYTAGYLVLLAFVAAPLRRSGAYTLPDFAEARLESTAVRRVASILVVVVGWLYLVPQLQGAGLTLGLLTGAPRWVGGLVVSVVVALTVAAGGMRSITFVQAFQYWLKLVALLVPALFLVFVWLGDTSTRTAFDEPPTFREATQVRVDDTIRIRVDAPLRVTVDGTVDGHRYRDAAVRLPPGVHRIDAGTILRFSADARVPERGGKPSDDRTHDRDTGPADESARSGEGSTWSGGTSAAPRSEYPLYATYGLILATFLGTMGLPHVVVRFYTSPDGPAARRTCVVVLGLVGLFYLLPPLYGVLGRIYAPELLLTGNTDAVVLLLPERLIGGVGGDLLGALIAAGACAAFLSTASGLTMAVAGVLNQDVLPSLRIRHFRLATLLAIAVPVLVYTAVVGLPVANSVGLAFAVSASSFCPLLILGIWWRRLTATGAVAGLLTGGGTALIAVALTMADSVSTSWLRTALAWPAVWTVPLAFLTMVLVSLADRRGPPARTDAIMARLHLPEPPADRTTVMPRRRSTSEETPDRRGGTPIPRVLRPRRGRTDP